MKNKKFNIIKNNTNYVLYDEDNLKPILRFTDVSITIIAVFIFLLVYSLGYITSSLVN